MGGYESFNTAAKFRRNTVEGSHIVCMVKIPPPFSLDGKNGDLYIVDVGCGVPVFEPIRVNSLSSAPYTSRAAGLDFAYELSSDGTVVHRINKGGDAIFGKKSEESYVSLVDYSIWLEPKTMEDLYQNLTRVYGIPESSPSIHRSFYLFKYLDIALDYSDFKVVCIRGKELITITKETRVCQSFNSYDDIEPLIHKFFPQILPHEISQAKFNFSQIEIEEARRA